MTEDCTSQRPGRGKDLRSERNRPNANGPIGRTSPCDANRVRSRRAPTQWTDWHPRRSGLTWATSAPRLPKRPRTQPDRRSSLQQRSARSASLAKMGGRIARLHCYNLNGFLFGVGLFPAAGSAARAAGPIPLQASCQPLVFPGEGQKFALWIWKAAAAGDLFQPGGQVPVVCAGREVPLRVAPSQAALGIVGGFGCVAWAASAYATLDSAPLLNARLPSTPDAA